MVIGLLGFSPSFVGIGLAIRALDTEGTLERYANGAFTLAGILLLLALMSALLIGIHYAKTKQRINKVGGFLRTGNRLHSELLIYHGIWDDKNAEPANQWEEKVQQWLENNLPAYAPDFGLLTIGGTTSSFFYDDVPREASEVALRLENRCGNLREILRDIRI